MNYTQFRQLYIKFILRLNNIVQTSITQKQTVMKMNKYYRIELPYRLQSVLTIYTRISSKEFNH